MFSEQNYKFFMKSLFQYFNESLLLLMDFFLIGACSLSSSFSDLKSEKLMQIALAIWYEDFTPNVSYLDSSQVPKAGYLIDRLSRYNCVSPSRKLTLLSLVNNLRCQLNENPEHHHHDADGKNVEPLAVSWTLSEDVSLLMPSLLVYQTRHYSPQVTVSN